MTETLLAFDNLLEIAERESGAYGLADAGLRARVRSLVDWVNARGSYTADQIVRMRHQVTRLLANRLRIALDRQQFPGITMEKIERPLVVVGLPRSGTTLLHSLLAEDPQANAPRAWHSLVPSPPPGAGPVAAGRIAQAQRSVERFLDFVPGLLPLHPYWDKGADSLIEDEEIFTLDFRNAYPTLLYDIPTLDVMVELVGADVPETYRFHREVLQHLQWNTGKTRWACKGVYHQFQLDALFQAYPDAICVWPHRALTEIHTSMVTIAAALFDQIGGVRIDWKQFARSSAESVKAGLDHMMSNPLFDDPRVVHLRFSDITADPVAQVHKVYERAGLATSAEHVERMQAWLADPANRADRYGRYPYTPEPFGLTKEWLADLFADYHRRAGLTD
jgi:Sulfotransferase family